MGKTTQLELLFTQASGYAFDAFGAPFEALAAALPAADAGEARLMRAQVKLFASDGTLLEDLERVAPACAPRFPCLGGVWLADCPNRFVVFNRLPGAMARFLEGLPRAGALLERHYGKAGLGMARQVESEALYFCGRFAEAAVLAQAQLDSGMENGTDILLALCTLYRCHMALGAPDEAERCMLEMIRTSKTGPEALNLYKAIRQWANLTTGWSGDNPRYRRGPAGEAVPVLEDRLSAIREGISHLNQREVPFVNFAQGSYPGATPLRQYFMDVFNAQYWLQAGDEQQAGDYFRLAYAVAAATGLVTPFVEYGRQIIPLLERAKNDGACPPEWAATVSALAGRYEDGLDAYRG